MWEIATELAATGPTSAEFAHDLEGLRAHFADPRSALSEAVLAACESVAGRDDLVPPGTAARAGKI